MYADGKSVIILHVTWGHQEAWAQILLLGFDMQSLSPEVQLTIAWNLSLCDLRTLSSVSKPLEQIASTYLFTAVKMQAVEVNDFQKALDVRFKACNIRTLTIHDELKVLWRVKSSLRFLAGLDNILQAITQIRELRLRIILPTRSPAHLGYYLDPRYAETVFRHQFEHLTAFEYTIQGEYANGGDSIHLPSFLNNHPTLKMIKLVHTRNPHRRVSAGFPSDIILNLPQLEFLDTPFGYFGCTLDTPLLQRIQVQYPGDDREIRSIQSSNLEEIWSDGTLAAMLPNLQDITIHRTWQYPNVELVFWIAENFANLCSLDIHGHYWVESDNVGLPEKLRNFKRLETFQYGRLVLPSDDHMFEDESFAMTDIHSQVAQSWKLACPSLRKIRINLWLKMLADCWRFCIVEENIIVQVEEDWVPFTGA
ncbi:hypothetical protein DFH09DRAFT_1088575 [Mycena vulgaris]|nr:hypothetical protein DFH09DRAFT_1088575 [Mycena vulgaris]